MLQELYPSLSAVDVFVCLKQCFHILGSPSTLPEVEGLYRRAHCSFELYVMSLAPRCTVTLLFPSLLCTGSREAAFELAASTDISLFAWMPFDRDQSYN